MAGAPSGDRTTAMLERLKPAVHPDAASRNAFEGQLVLGRSQWFPRAQLEAHQHDRLKTLARYASQSVPYWRARLVPDAIEHAATLADLLAAIPILSRASLRDNLAALAAENLPQGHAPAGQRSSSGSTGMVVVVNTTNVMLSWQDALTLRAQVWALRDFSQSMAVIRKYPKGPSEYPDGFKTQSWSPSAFPFTTGPAMFLTTSYTSLEQQWEWLNRMRAAYLMTYPSVVRGFAKLAEKEGKLPSCLRGITTVGEVVDPDLRELAVRFLDAPIHDIYSSEEAGIMALQCPHCTAYHVQSESVIVEVLNGNDRPCAPGETGRVVVTPLHNYAMPLLRYEIGDFALVGEPCGCGRELPTLERIMGRRRNMLTLPDGTSYWPSFGARRLQKIVPMTEHQFRQIAPGVIEALLVTEAPVDAAQESEMKRIINAGLPMPFEVHIRCVPEIPRPAGGKYEEFVSLV